MFRSSGNRIVLLTLIWLFVLGVSVPATAQGDRSFRALAELHVALDGKYGDEGAEISRRLDELSAALAQRDAARDSAPSNVELFDAAGAPVFPLARYADAFVLLIAGKGEEGIARLREAVRGDPLIPARSTQMGVGISALRKGDLAAAAASLDAAVRSSPESSEAHRVLATVLGLRGDVANSIDHLQTAVRLRPDDERSWIALGRAQIEAGRLTDAASVLERGVKALPQSGDLRWRLAGVYLRVQRSSDALEQYDAVSRLPALSGKAEVFERLAVVAASQQDVPRTVAALQQLLTLTPDNATAHRDLAAEYTKQGRLDEAFSELATAVTLEPQDPLILVALAHNHMARQRDADAVAALERAVMLQPDLRDAQYALAQALIRVGRQDEGRQHLARFQKLRADAIERDTREDELATLKGRAAAQSSAGQHRAAVQTWTEVLKQQPRVAQNYVDLADALAKAGDLELSVQYLVQAAELNGVADVHLRLARVLAQMGRARESALARQTYERLRVEDFQRSHR